MGVRGLAPWLVRGTRATVAAQLGRIKVRNEQENRRFSAVFACDAAVVGGGPAGITAALALAHVGAEVALIGPPPTKPGGHFM